MVEDKTDWGMILIAALVFVFSFIPLVIGYIEIAKWLAHHGQTVFTWVDGL